MGFFCNIPTLAWWAEQQRSSVYALDWFGMGRSAWVPFTAFFINAQTVGLERIL